MINKNKVLNMFRQIKNKNVYKFLLIFLKFFELTIDVKIADRINPSSRRRNQLVPFI